MAKMTNANEKYVLQEAAIKKV